MIEEFLLLTQSNIGIALICFSIAFWVLKLHAKNEKLENEKSIGNKASKKDLESLKEEYQTDVHKLELRITTLEIKSKK